MDVRKLEHIVLIILVLLNAVLLALLLRGRAVQRQEQQETLEKINVLLAERGITAERDVDLLQKGAAQCTVVRDLEREDQRMQGLLGTHNREDMGGGIWYYRSDRGQVVMRGTGELSILPTGDWISPGRGAAGRIQSLMRRAGTELWVSGDAAQQERDVELCCCWEGFPVFNAQLDFSFSGDRMDLVIGTAVFDRATARVPNSAPDAVSMLVRVLDRMEEDGILFSRLLDLTAGYRMQLTINGESTLYPVWLLETDTGIYYYDVQRDHISGQLG